MDYKQAEKIAKNIGIYLGKVGKLYVRRNSVQSKLLERCESNRSFSPGSNGTIELDSFRSVGNNRKIVRYRTNAYREERRSNNRADVSAARLVVVGVNEKKA